MSKRNNISYIKPQDPSFLAKLKAQIGYREGPTIEAKRQKQEHPEHTDSEGEERPEHEDEKPQIVVLRSGDLNAEEVANEEKRIAKEEANAPADLSQPIIFQKRKPKDTAEADTKLKKKSKKKSKQTSSSKLSFNNDEEDEPEVEI